MWAQRPVIHEINAWAWITRLERKYKRKLDLRSIPTEEWDELTQFGADGIWLMGVWERSPQDCFSSISITETASRLSAPQVPER
jgi:hypothetical protein